MAAPPRSEAELADSARAIAGCTLQTLAERCGLAVPSDTRRAKGWVGTLIETLLGATAGSRSEPDFQLIGVELKTIPINRSGVPRESTYVCTVPLTRNCGVSWESCNVHRKLRRVLWMPIESDPDLPLRARRVGSPLLWSPSRAEEQALRADWEDLMDMVCLGELALITAHHGTWLQIRPKAANSRARRIGFEATGEPVKTLPRGFYLRPGFTQRLLREHYAMPEPSWR